MIAYRVGNCNFHSYPGRDRDLCGFLLQITFTIYHVIFVIQISLLSKHRCVHKSMDAKVLFHSGEFITLLVSDHCADSFELEQQALQILVVALLCLA